VRTEPVQLILKTYIPRPVFEEQFSSGRGFSFKESPLYVKIKLLNPEIAYRKDLQVEKEELISVISYGLIRGKSVEIDCGPANLKTNYVAGELIDHNFVKSVQNQDGQSAKAELETRRIRHSFFSIFGTKHNFVTFDRVRERTSRNDNISNAPYFEDIIPYEPCVDSETDYLDLPDNSSDFDPVQEPDHNLRTEISDDAWELINEGNRYFKAPIVIVDYDDVYHVVSQIDYWLEQRGIVQIKRRDQNDRIEELGMFLEKEFTDDEVVFNLNGQTENHFRNLFKSLAMYYLRAGKIVMVDCDVELYEDDLPKIWDRVLEGEIHDMVYQPIVSELGVSIGIERRKVQRAVVEEKNYIVMSPKIVK
jgi:hypothetical protein